MSSIVLIHGSTQNRSCWDLVRPYLADGGHQIIAVELPADRPENSASDFARLAVDQMRGAPDDCVLVAHSASGILLPLIARLRPVKALVYLAAMIPAPGSSVMDQLQSEPDMLHPDWLRAGSQWSDSARWRELADHFLFQDVALSVREWAYSTIRPMRLDAAGKEPLSLSAIARVRSLLVVCQRDRTINPKWQERVWRTRAAEKGQLRHLDAGHCPHISTPRETAAEIEAACHERLWNHTMEELEELQRRKHTLGYVRAEPLQQPIDYDAFMMRKGHERFELMLRLTPENKAEMFRTHRRRWMEANRDRLTLEQIELLQEHIAFITPELYEQPQKQETVARQDELLERSYALFSREELWLALSIRAQHVPETGRKHR
jgi:pimeloyl-ACP methyl ester carboxylesterase